MKKCTKCGLEKPVDAFPQQKRYRPITRIVYYIAHTHCRQCHVVTADAWNKDHPNRIAEIHKNYRQRNPEKVLMWGRKKEARHRARMGTDPVYAEAYRKRRRELYRRNKIKTT